MSLLTRARPALPSSARSVATLQSCVEPTPAPLSTLPYFVRRTSNRMLPVYHELKNSGTRHLTIVRRIDGDAASLQRDLQAALPASKVWVKPTTGHVLVKGLYAQEIKRWLSDRGF